MGGFRSHLIGDEWRIMAKNQPGPQEHFFYKMPFRNAGSDLVLVIQLFRKRSSVGFSLLKRNLIQALFFPSGSTFSSLRRKMPDKGSVAVSM